MHTPAVAHDMHSAHALTILVEEHLRRMHLPRRSQNAYQQQPIGLRIPLRMLYCLHLSWQPLFEMQALFEMPASQQITARNRACRLVPFSEKKSRNQKEFFLIILAFYRLQRPLTRRVPSWANLQVIAKSMSCHGYKIQVCTLQRHTQTGVKSHRPASSHVRRPHWNRCTVVHLCLCPDFLMHIAATHTFLLTLQRHTRMISYSFSYSYSGKQKRRKTRKWQVIRTDRWRFTKSSFRNLFRNRLHWCPMLPVIRRKTTRTMCTLFRVEESYTTSETHRMWRSLHFLDQCLFTALFKP
jgi:hypothetical protein